MSATKIGGLPTKTAFQGIGGAQERPRPLAVPMWERNAQSSYKYQATEQTLSGLPGVAATTVTTATRGANTMTYTPFWCERPAVATGYMYEITTGGTGGTSHRIGIYTASGTYDRQPGKLLWGSLPLGSDSVSIVTATMAPITMEPGLHFLALQNGAGNPTYRVVQIASWVRLPNSIANASANRLDSGTMSYTSTAELPTVAPYYTPGTYAAATYITHSLIWSYI